MDQESAYLDLTILSAADLKRKWLSGDQTVAVVWVDPLTKKTTSVVSGNGSTVQWHERLNLTLDVADTFLPGKLLTIEIHARGTWGDSLLGSVYVPLVDLDLHGEKRGNTTLMYQIVQPSGKRQGSMKFFAKVVMPRVSGSIVPLSGSVVPLPSAPPRIPVEDYCTGLGSSTFYPPASAIRPVETNDERPSTVAYSPHPKLEVSPYPPQLHFHQNYAAEHDAWQPDPSYGMGSYPPQVYPPVNTTYPPCTSPHSNYTGIVTYPPLSPQFLETPYPPPASVYPPPPLTEAPYPPTALYPPYPPTAPHPSEMYPPASSYPYSNFSSPFNPPPYPQQQAAVRYPYPSYCCTSF